MQLKKTFLFLLIAVLQVSCASASVTNRIPRKAFVKIYTTISILECRKKSKMCKKRTWGSVGSGAIIRSTNNNSYILTAGHVCNVEITKKGLEEIKTLNIEIQILNHKGKFYRTRIIHSNDLSKNEVDLCLLESDRLDHSGIRLSLNEPKVGDKIYSMGAPAGIYHPPTVPILEGIYSGKMPDGLNFLSSIPAVGGSSGSPVFNRDLKLIGVIFATHPKFNQISISTGFEETRKFIKEHLHTHLY